MPVVPLAVALVAFAAPHSRQTPEWSGSVFQGGLGTPTGAEAEWDPLALRVDSIAADGTATGIAVWSHPGRDESGPLVGSLDGERLLLGVEGAEVRLEATVEGDALTGRWFEGDREWPVSAVRTHGVPRATREELAGVYTDGATTFLVTADDRVEVVVHPTGERRALYATADDAFASGPAYRVPLPREETWRFERDAEGRPTALVRGPADGEGPSVRAERLATTSEPFEVALEDGVVLRGTLTLPPGDGPHPAALWVHGSGRTARSAAGAWVPHLVSRGMAVLAVDKRGVPESDGSYALPDGSHDDRAHMERRADDVAQTLAALRRHPAVVAERTGLVGISQAGWVIPLAAPRAEPAFALILSGGATRLHTEAVFSELAGEVVPDSPDALERALEAARETARTSDEPAFREPLEQLRCEAFWIWGDDDRSNPTALCVAEVEAARRNVRTGYGCLRVPDANHALMESERGGSWETFRLRRVSPLVVSAVDLWVDRHVLEPEPEPEPDGE